MCVTLVQRFEQQGIGAVQIPVIIIIKDTEKLHPGPGI